MSFFSEFKDGMGLFGKAFSMPINTVLLLIVYFVGIGLSKLLKKKTEKVTGWIDCKKKEDCYRQF